MNRRDLFLEALRRSTESLQRSPFMFPLESVIKQLRYLLDVEEGRATRDELNTVDIGKIAARDIDEYDSDLADLLHDVSAEVESM